MAFEHYVNAGGKRLRCGFTTGTCAALASQAALRFLLTGHWPEKVSIMTPKGWEVSVSPEACQSSSELELIKSGTGSLKDKEKSETSSLEDKEKKEKGSPDDKDKSETNSLKYKQTEKNLTESDKEAALTVPDDESGRWASCGIRKDGGDDIDKTTGALIMAQVSLTDESGIVIDGGFGVGRVTRPGLDQSVGNAAINSVPRKMIRETLEDVCKKMDYHGGVKALIYVPEGEEIAKKTFNPHLGIEGGISILGTSGVVEPMSTQALIDTICVEIRQAKAVGHKSLILTPGNYGQDFLNAHQIYPEGTAIVQCSNFIGEALDECGRQGFEAVLLVGHVGKLVKLAGGIMNTHSHQADCRAELFTAHAALCGADRETVKALMDSVSTDACLEILDKAGLKDEVAASLLQAIEKHLKRRAEDKYKIGALMFSNVYGELGYTKEAGEIIDKWK